MSFDLVIIGGGPAGATGAQLVAKTGLKVLLLEAAEEGRYKCCAGGIPISNEDFSAIPQNVKEREITGGVMVTPGNGVMEFEAEGEKNRGFCMFRTDFDKFLLDLARDAGTQIEFNSMVKKIERKENGKYIIIANNEYRSNCLIIATGVGGARLQRSLGIEVPPSVNGIQAEFAIPEREIDDLFANKIWEFFDSSIVDHGVGWAFPKKEAVSIGILSPNAKISQFNLFLKTKHLKEKLFNRQMLSFKGKKIWAAPIPDHVIKKPYKSGIMVVGDACGVTDPVLYEGIYQARLSAKLAAETFINAYEAEDFSEEVLSQYDEKLLRELYDDNLRYAYKIHQLLFHSGQLEELIDAVYLSTKNDPEMKEAVTALFSGSITRRAIWRTMMAKKWKLMKLMGISNGMRLLPSLFRAMRIK